MRRLISISMVAVLAGWLAIPVAGAHFASCDMKCCRRAATVATDCSHAHASGNAENEPEIHAGSSACQGKCCVQGSIQLGSAEPALASVFLDTQISSSFLSSSDLHARRHYQHSGRAPPYAA
jgi:hypothetical protein